jgi:hypothetical protein
MTTLMQASQQWRSRPADKVREPCRDAAMQWRRQLSTQDVVTTRKLTLYPAPDNEQDRRQRGLMVGVEDGRLAGQQLSPTHMAFGQLCSLAATPSPASYFRESGLPAAYIADCLNFNLRVTRDIEDIGVLGHVDQLGELRAATGPSYGRV